MGSGGQVSDVDRVARAHGGVFTLGDAQGAGISRGVVRWAELSGKAIRLRQGVYTSARIWSRLSAAQRQRLILLAYQRIDRRLIGCGLSAAAALPLPLPDDRRPIPSRASVHRFAELPVPVTRPSLRKWEAGEPVLRLRAGPVLTSALRIVLDCARLLPREWGLVIADAAIAGGWLELAELEAAGESIHARGFTGPRGIRTARWVLSHARAEVESPLESLARAVIIGGGFPEPVPQQWIRTGAGSFRVDLLDAENRVITEADGKVKYVPDAPAGRLLTGPSSGSPDAGTGDRVRATLWQEKLREDALRDAGFEVVRFTRQDLNSPSPWHSRYAKALHRAQRFN